MSSLTDVSTLSRWLLPLLATGSMVVLIPYQIDVVAQAEVRFLALFSGVMLAALAALGGRTEARRVTLPTALLVVATVWVAPADPHRGALVALILTLAVGGSLALLGFDRRGHWSPGTSLRPAVALGLAMVIQATTRSELLLSPTLEPGNLVRLIGLPVLAAGALSFLSLRFGVGRSLLVGAVAGLSAPGWNTPAVLAVVALAAGCALGREQPTWVRALGVAVLAALPLWQPPWGALLALAGVALFAGARGTLPILALAFAATMFFSAPGGRLESLQLWMVGVLVWVPAAFLCAPAERPSLRAGAVLALAAALVIRTPEALAAGLGLMALAVPERGPAASLQAVWTATVATGVALLSAFPWLRNEPLDDTLNLLGLDDLSYLLVPAGLVIGLGFLAPLWESSPRGLRPRPWALGVLLVALALARGVTPSTVLLERYQTAVLDSSVKKTIFIEYEPREVASVLVETSLAHSVELTPGTPVARVKLRDPNRKVLQTWEIRSGFDTAEWASSRADLRSLPTHLAPDPWISLLSPEGTFFANHFRTELRLPAPTLTGSITIDRVKSLPQEVQVLVYRLEIRPRASGFARASR